MAGDYLGSGPLTSLMADLDQLVDGSPARFEFRPEFLEFGVECDDRVTGS